MFAWLVIDEPFSASFYRAMALLVAASPCALAIATPSAVLSGVARAARGCVLVKGGRRSRTWVNSKRLPSTRREPRPRASHGLSISHRWPGIGEFELLAVAVAVEALSDHPLADAVVNDGRQRLGKDTGLAVTDLRSITGRGVEARVEGALTHISKPVLFSEIGGPRCRPN